MNTDASAPKRLRADAARNSAKILRSAREVYAESGPDAPLEEIARRAGVGIATLYRRFPDKGELVHAALEQSFVEKVSPVIERALGDDDPVRGLVTVLEATLSLVLRERNTLTAARNLDVLSIEAGSLLFVPLAELTRRGQRAGLVRADLVPDDLPRIMTMLISVPLTMSPGSGNWQRYLALVLDSLSPAGATALPPLESASSDAT
ncbi:TetR/AcrR family transcriptional regulator [Nocardiopsis synnemataformans]|uniref:TetR/AcrR family transcriptional regulator n=1 Tax=Nocardiopsis synnemataformans TaxID=61305 RepID=UPI003EBDF0FA